MIHKILLNSETFLRFHILSIIVAKVEDSKTVDIDVYREETLMLINLNSYL